MRKGRKRRDIHMPDNIDVKCGSMIGSSVKVKS
jgi:hypothetical protein